MLLNRFAVAPPFLLDQNFIKVRGLVIGALVFGYLLLAAMPGCQYFLFALRLDSGA
jgi:hypothetical protein